jgi:hypothetical protein
MAGEMDLFDMPQGKFGKIGAGVGAVVDRRDVGVVEVEQRRSRCDARSRR